MTKTTKPPVKKAPPKKVSSGKKDVKPPSANKVDVEKLISAVSQNIKDDPPKHTPKASTPVKRVDIEVPKMKPVAQETDAGNDLGPVGVSMPATSTQIREKPVVPKLSKGSQGKITIADIFNSGTSEKAAPNFPFKFRNR